MLPTGVLALDLSSDTKTAFASCIDGGVYSVALDAGTLQKIGAHDSYASGVAALDSSTIASAGYDGILQWHKTNVEKPDQHTSKKVSAHQFWSWQLAASRDGKRIASVTGQYICGGYKYEPLPKREPSVRVYDAQSNELLHSFTHVP